MPYKANSDLPEAVRGVLPEEAQTVWRRVFNQWAEEHSEESAFKVAWTAVKRGWEKPEGEGKWKRRSQDAFTSVDIKETIAFDRDANLKITPDGYMIATPRVARSGIQIYGGHEVGKPKLDNVRVYRPPEEVFSQDSMHSYAHRPVTNNHPPELITADNWKKYAIGQTGEEVLRDGQFIRVPLVFMDANSIKDVSDGKQELSLGYTMDLLWEAGETDEGEQYDAVQTNIVANHLALVDRARGGPNLRVGDDILNRELNRGEHVMTLKTITVDGLPVEVSDMAANVISKTIAGYDATVAELKKKLAEAEKKEKEDKEKAEKDAADAKSASDKITAELATVKAQLADASMTPAKLDQLLKDRGEVIAKAKKIIGDKLVIENKSANEIRRQVVDTKLGDTAKGWSDEQVGASFGTLTADVKIADNNSDPVVDAFRSRPHSYNTNDSDAAKAWDEANKARSEAWRTPAAKVA